MWQDPHKPHNRNCSSILEMERSSGLEGVCDETSVRGRLDGVI
jgi:hypothetical protein